MNLCMDVCGKYACVYVCMCIHGWMGMDECIYVVYMNLCTDVCGKYAPMYICMNRCMSKMWAHFYKSLYSRLLNNEVSNCSS